MSALDPKHPVSPKTARGQIEEFDYIISTIDPSKHSGSPEMEKAKSELIALAEQGYWPACLELYERAEQLFHFEQPAPLDWMSAQQEQQLAYNQAIAAGQAQVKAQGRVYLEKAVEGGYAPAQFRLAMELQREAELEASSVGGYEYGSRGAASLLNESKIGEEEPKKEKFTIPSLLEQAADQGYALAQIGLVKYLLDEMSKVLSQPKAALAKLPVKMKPSDKHRILDLLEAAGRAGIAQALFTLGTIYSSSVDNRHGFSDPVLLELGVEVDYKKAAAFYVTSAQQGYWQAIASIVELLGSDDLAYYQALKQLAEEGYVEAQYQLGVFYQGCTGPLRRADVGFEVEAPRVPAAIQSDMSNGETAEKWWQKAADNLNYSAWRALNTLRGESRAYPYDQRALYHVPEQPASAKTRVLAGEPKALVQLPVEEWNEDSWTSHYKYLWRKQCFEDDLLARSEGLPVERKRPFPLLYYVLISLLGAGGSLLAFQVSGTLSLLTALGWGSVAPFFLAGVLGALLATSLMIGLHLSLNRGLNHDTRKALLGFLAVLAPLSLSGVALLLAVTIFASTGLVALALASILGALIGVELVLSLALINKPKDKVSASPQKSLLLPRNSIEAFDLITLASRNMPRNLQKTKNELLDFAEQGYLLACLELYNRAEEFFYVAPAEGQESHYLTNMQAYRVAHQADHLKAHAEARRQGRVYLDQAAKGGYAPAQFLLAMELQAEEKAAETAQGRRLDAFSSSQDQGESRVHNIEEQKEEGLSPQSLLEQAAAQGHAPAQFALALVLIEKFARQAPAPQAFDERAAAVVEPAQTQTEKAKILELLEASAKAGNPVALVVLGDIYSHYSGYRSYSNYYGVLQNREVSALAFSIESDHNKALMYYSNAAKQGSSDAIMHIADLEGDLRIEQPDSSIYYPALKQLAEEGYVEAQYRLGVIYEGFEQPSADLMQIRQPQKPPAAIQADMESGQTAEKWYKKAVNNHHRDAGYALNTLRKERTYYPYHQEVYHVPEPLEVQVAEQLSEQKQVLPVARSFKKPSVQAWHKGSWISRCDYNWRKQHYDRAWFVANAEKDQVSVGKAGAPIRTVEQQYKLLALLRFFWPRYSVGFLLGAGGSILAFQLSGILSVLTAVGLGPVAPFFIVGTVGALLGFSLVLSLHLSLGGLDEEARKVLLKSLLVLAPVSLSGLALLLAVTVFAATGPAALAIASVLGVLVGILPVLSFALMKPSHPVARMLLGSLGKDSDDADLASKKISKVEVGKTAVARERKSLLDPESVRELTPSREVFRDRASRSSALSSLHSDEDDDQERSRLGRLSSRGSDNSDSEH